MSEIDPHLQNAMYGTPEVNPDEKHYYLGTFKERVYMTQTMKSLADAQYQSLWKKELQQHPDALLLLNGRADSDKLNLFMQLAQSQQVDFRLVNDPELVRSPLAVVLAADHAVHQKQIEIENLASATKEEASSETVKSKPWYRRLF